jgi:hypothetical protein
MIVFVQYFLRMCSGLVETFLPLLSDWYHSTACLLDWTIIFLRWEIGYRNGEIVYYNWMMLNMSKPKVYSEWECAVLRTCSPKIHVTKRYHKASRSKGGQQAIQKPWKGSRIEDSWKLNKCCRITTLSSTNWTFLCFSLDFSRWNVFYFEYLTREQKLYSPSKSVPQSYGKISKNELARFNIVRGKNWTYEGLEAESQPIR